MIFYYHELFRYGHLWNYWDFETHMKIFPARNQTKFILLSVENFTDEILAEYVSSFTISKSGASWNDSDFKEYIVVERFLEVIQIIARNILTCKYLGDFLNVDISHMWHVELAGFQIFRQDLSSFIESRVFDWILCFYQR